MNDEEKEVLRHGNVFIFKVVRSSGWENVQEIYIKHPRTNVKSLFLLCKKKDDNDFHIFEVLTMQQDTRYARVASVNFMNFEAKCFVSTIIKKYICHLF